MRLFATKIRPAFAQELAEGSEVLLLDDHGELHETRTRSRPWKLGDGTLVVLVEGRTGGYDLERIWRVLGPQL